jgi:hypothetical protein
MRSSFWQRFVSFPAMLVTILLSHRFFASLDVQQGGPVMRDPDIWWHLRNAPTLLSTHPRSVRHGRDRLWLLVSLFALWINLHGSWLIGYTFLMLYLASGPGRGGVMGQH